MNIFVGHAESIWMARARSVAYWSRFFVLGLLLGGLVDLAVRLVVGQ